MATLQNAESLLDDFSSVLANDPGALDATDEWYVANLHGSGAEDVVSLLERAIRRTAGGQLYYFSGQRGTGKSTELRRLETLLNGQPKTRAYVVDALEYIGDTHPIDTLDLLLIVAVAFADRLSQPDAFGQPVVNEDNALQRFGKWLHTEVEITGFTLGGVKTEFKRQQQSIVSRIHAFDLARQERVIAECQDFIGQLAEAVKKRWQADKVVLMVDSLERLRGIGGAATEMFTRIVKVFDGDLHQLRIPQVQMVYAVPPYLPYLTNVKALVQLFTLASVRVCEAPGQARRQLRASGLQVMQSLVSKRFADWAKVISVGALNRLIQVSGGDIRQLLRRLLLGALDQAYFAQDRLPLAETDNIITTVIEAHRVDFENLVVQDEFPLLKGIADRNALELRKREDLPVIAHFFDVRAVLNYRNGVEWLDINPLLWRLIDGWQAAPGPNEPNGSI